MSNNYNFRIAIIPILTNLMVEATPSCPIAQPGPRSAVVEIGDDCGPDDMCEGGGICMLRCCHPNLANLDNLKECGLGGWIERCKSGYKVVHPPGEDIWSAGCTPTSMLLGKVLTKGIKNFPQKSLIVVFI